MAKYYFHIGDSEAGLDKEGVELPSDNDAKIQAAQMIGELIRDKAGEFWDECGMRLTVTDKSGLILFVLDLTAIEAPALGQRRPREG